MSVFYLKSGDIKMYSSNDLYFVAYMYSKGIQPVEIEAQGSKYIFHYDDDRYEKINKDFYSRRCSIEPIQYQQGIRMAKSIIYNRQEVKC